ncbi:MAG: 4-hydroxythreonine-4-phosphate dehydrogenase PdxA [Tepidamorphaceae bacterium]|nr:4-hydroxythreonine-4-phosphate dehydrogenase PdxA [Rhodobiaceae bacterium]MCC0050028.1 4-hydroxythreonine-4-phosphate dehydrogenase PdxA [Rhodobiaceae bacterium]
MSAPLALTIGEPAGIGPELAAMAFLRRKQDAIPPFVLVGDASIIARRATAAGLGKLPLKLIDASEMAHASTIFDEELPVLAVACAGNTVRAGKPDPANAGLVTGAIETAVNLVHTGKAGAVVTNPISKEVLYSAGFRFPGHTEYLGQLAHDIWNVDAHPVMMLAGPDLRVVPVTVHIPLSEVPGSLTRELIVTTVRTLARDLERRFGISRPRIAIAGLNPHAGEGGTIGKEETKTVIPAIELLQRISIDVTGPLPADTMFHARARANYDAAVCMYHDQALIPIKTIAFDTGVNVTLGLPFIRTSPDHGTAFDIAGTGKADPSSLIEALKMAAGMAAREQAQAASAA